MSSDAVARDSRISIAAFVRGELGESRLSYFNRLDNFRNLFYLGFDWLAIVAAVAVSTAVDSWLVYVLAVCWIGSRQRALINLVHQASHSQLFRDRRLNQWLGSLFCGFPLLMCIGPYRSQHLRHHGHLWDDHEDPKSVWYSAMGLLRGAGGPLRFLGHALSKFGLHVTLNLRDALAWHDARRREWLAIGLFWAAVIGIAVVLGGVEILVLYWIVPYLTVFQLIRYVTTASDHAGLKSPNPWLATRTWNSGVLVRLFVAPHSDSYHLAHHLVPSVPHYRLAELHRDLMRIPEYAAGHHCDGLVIPRRSDAPSVLSDICHPGDISRYKRMPATFLGTTATSV